MAAARLTGATREEHRLLHTLCTTRGVRLSPSGHSLIYKPRGVPLPRTRAHGWVLLHGITAPARVLAHILRVGPDGPLADQHPPGPHDRDPHNVHPDNWTQWVNLEAKLEAKL